jgi:PhzF family phenazine biosynthesis protein
MSRRYVIVDVFTREPLRGNPVAVVLDTAGLDSAAMQSIAHWFNLSETTFWLPATEPGADYRLRIFTPGSELPFAGHPTLGSARAICATGLAAPNAGRLIQQCGAGLVELREGGPGADTWRLKLPPAQFTPVAPAALDELRAALGEPAREQIDLSVAPAIVDVGPRWLVARIGTATALRALTPDSGRLAALERRLGITGATLFAPADDGCGPGALEVRSFAPSAGVIEDPVCGSGNGSVAAFQLARGLLSRSATRYEARQGRCVGRDGRVEVTIDGSGDIWIGGACVTVAHGLLDV